MRLTLWAFMHRVYERLTWNLDDWIAAFKSCDEVEQGIIDISRLSDTQIEAHARAMRREHVFLRHPVYNTA